MKDSTNNNSPIHYASLLNGRNVVVLQGVNASSQTNFKKQVEQNAEEIKHFGYSEVGDQESNLKIMYYNWDTVTAAIVVSLHIDRQECQEFFVHFKQFIEANLLGKEANYQAPEQMIMMR